jgi:hypothetical protein
MYKYVKNLYIEIYNNYYNYRCLEIYMKNLRILLKSIENR